VLENAGQHFNHSFQWRSLRPPSAGGPGGSFLEAVRESFSSLDSLRAAFTEACVGHFGSGWCWLVKDPDGSLKVVTTHDAGALVAGTALATGQVPLLVCDVWEHAYYLDHRSDRAAYLESFWKVADWEFAERNFEVPVLSGR
jgi:superoxide dismutase, Fe-Mn family